MAMRRPADIETFVATFDCVDFVNFRVLLTLDLPLRGTLAKDLRKRGLNVFSVKVGTQNFKSTGLASMRLQPVNLTR
jgi:hypothetical protein